MARSDYGPGRRRKPTIAWLLDWAAGVLVGILTLMVGAGLLSLFIEQGAERVQAFARMSALVWPLGAGLGVWLSVGRPLRAAELGAGVGASVLAVAIVLCPLLLGAEGALVRTGLALLALIVAPACARLAMMKLREPG